MLAHRQSLVDKHEFSDWVIKYRLDAGPASDAADRFSAMWIAERWDELAPVLDQLRHRTPNYLRQECRAHGYPWAFGWYKPNAPGAGSSRPQSEASCTALPIGAIAPIEAVPTAHLSKKQRPRPLAARGKRESEFIRGKAVAGARPAPHRTKKRARAKLSAEERRRRLRALHPDILGREQTEAEAAEFRSLTAKAAMSKPSRT